MRTDERSKSRDKACFGYALRGEGSPKGNSDGNTNVRFHQKDTLERIFSNLDLWEGEYTYRCILTNDYDSSEKEIVEFYNLRGGKERVFDDMNNGFGWNRLPKSFMAENTVFLLLTALIRNFYRFIMERLDVKRFGLKATSRIKAFVFRFISVPAKWIKTSRQYVLNIYTCNNAYAEVFQTDFG